MIKHHPKFGLLQNYVNGELPASLAAGIAIHADMCTQCKAQIAQLTEQTAESCFEFDTNEHYALTVDMSVMQDLDEMIAQITADTSSFTESDNKATVADKSLNFKGKNYSLPNVLQRMDIGSPTNIGKLSRAKVQLEEGEIHTNLLHIEPGGSVPEHTHKGFELTVLLAGSFSDDNGEYVAGDFIMLDGKHTHHPISNNGCLCYTVANDALYFTQGINKLLNPIGPFIY